MKNFLICSAAAAALVTSGAAFAQSAQQAKETRAPAAQPVTRAMVQARVAATFAKLDTNHDGFITKDELNAIEAQRAQKIEQRAASFDPSKIFDRLDSNHDGKITIAEVNAARSQRAPGKATKITAFQGILAQADANKDGVVTRAEFDVIGQRIKARIQQAGMTTGGLAARMFAVADSNKDGRISLAEMQQVALARFDRVDLNHDGTITPQERQQAAQIARSKNHAG